MAGTGGGICGPTEDGNLFLAPTGVHKELVQPRDFFVVNPADGSVGAPAGGPRPPAERVRPDLLRVGADPRRRLVDALATR